MVLRGHRRDLSCKALSFGAIVDFKLLAKLVILNGAIVVLGIEVKYSSKEIEILEGKDILVVITMKRVLVKLIEIQSALRLNLLSC